MKDDQSTGTRKYEQRMNAILYPFRETPKEYVYINTYIYNIHPRQTRCSARAREVVGVGVAVAEVVKEVIVVDVLG